MSQTQNKLVIFAVVLALLALVLSLYSVITIQSLASRITDLSNSVSGLKSDIQALSQQIGKAVPTQPAPQQKVKLVVIGPWSGDEAKYFQAVIEAYQRTHPNVEIEYRTMRAEDVAATMPIQFAAGVAPGDVIFGWGWFIAKMGKEGHLVDLTSIIKQDEYVSGILDAVKADGKFW